MNNTARTHGRDETTSRLGCPVLADSLPPNLRQRKLCPMHTESIAISVLCRFFNDLNVLSKTMFQRVALDMNAEQGKQGAHAKAAKAVLRQSSTQKASRA